MGNSQSEPRVKQKKEKTNVPVEKISEVDQSEDSPTTPTKTPEFTVVCNIERLKKFKGIGRKQKLSCSVAMDGPLVATQRASVLAGLNKENMNKLAEIARTPDKNSAVNRISKMGEGRQKYRESVLNYLDAMNRLRNN